MGRKDKSTLTRFFRSIEYYVFIFTVKALSLLPLGFTAKAGELIGGLLYVIDGRHRNLALRNLSMALGWDRDSDGLKQIARRSLENLGRSGGEFISARRYTKENIREFVIFEGLENFEFAHKEGRGVIMLTGHFGNWELLGIAISLLGYPFHVVVRPLDNRPLDKRVNELRSIGGNKVIYKKNALGESLRLLKKRQLVGFLIDQNTSREEGVFVDFFGKEAATNRGLALIALKSRAPVVPVFIIREGPVNHRVVFEKGVEVTRSGDISEDITKNTQRFTKIIES
ncbi:MAG TPA: lysophospholipid acyltransferase family protein, partial [Nitrospiria bacterium]|nr:lysophospholipid acyltransferase family protein [Nitrospiria bacterium]